MGFATAKFGARGKKKRAVINGDLSQTFIVFAIAQESMQGSKGQTMVLDIPTWNFHPGIYWTWVGYIRAIIRQLSVRPPGKNIFRVATQALDTISGRIPSTVAPFGKALQP